jgi:hypothetical protein
MALGRDDLAAGTARVSAGCIRGRIDPRSDEAGPGSAGAGTNSNKEAPGLDWVSGGWRRGSYRRRDLRIGGSRIVLQPINRKPFNFDAGASDFVGAFGEFARINLRGRGRSAYDDTCKYCKQDGHGLQQRRCDQMPRWCQRRHV